MVLGGIQGGHTRLAMLALAGMLLTTSCSVIADAPFAAVAPTREPRDEDPDRPARRERRQPERMEGAASQGPARSPVSSTAVATSRPGAGTPAEATPHPDDGGSATPHPDGSIAPARPEPTVRIIRLRPRPRPGRFSVDLYRRGDFVHQVTKDWCVAGSTQTMLNIIRPGRADRSARTQERLYLRGRRLSPDKRKLGPIGVDLIGWAELLERAGAGPYVVSSARTRRAAIQRAARALRMTGRPVGLVTWRGAHSWVMSGFTATADPAYRRRFEVTAVYIQDVWYPFVSTIWGASRPPDSLVPVAALGEDYLPYRRPRARWPNRDGTFMLILPQLPRHTIAR